MSTVSHPPKQRASWLKNVMALPRNKLLSVDLDFVVRLGTAIGILWAAYSYFAEAPIRQEQAHYAAWDILQKAQNQYASFGRIEALQVLNRDHVSLVALQVTGAMLEGIDLRGAKLQFANMQYTDLNHADLDGANLDKADLRHGYMANINLRSASLWDSDLTNADLSHANLTDANLIGANLTNAQLGGADLTGARVTADQLKKVNTLAGATMPDGLQHS
jgi:uncharacterized protein YjbI with pentapeptide repeats